MQKHRGVKVSEEVGKLLSISMGSTGSGRTAGSQQEQEAPLIPHGRFIPFIVVTALFFLWAIPNNLNDILIRQFMKSFEINRSGAAGIQIWFYLGYFLLAVPAGQLMHRYGYKLGIVTGLVLLGTGCLLFYPAAQMGLYWFFLVAQFIIASGLSFLETASNPFIAQLGPTASSERRLNFSQAFNPLGSITAGLIGTWFIFSGVHLSDSEAAAMQAAGTYHAYLHAETLRVVVPYLVLGTVALLWAVLVGFTKFSSHGCGGCVARGRGTAETCAPVSAPLCDGGAGAVFVCGRAGGHLELLHPLR